MPRKPAQHSPDPPTNEDVENRQLLKEINAELLGERIRLARVEMKVTQRGLCLNLFTSAYLSSMELGKTRPTLHNLKQIAGRVNKPIGFFLRPPTTGFGGFSHALQQEQTRLLQLRQGLLQVSIVMSKHDTAEATNLLNQVKPYLTRLPDLDQATYHLWQAAVFNMQKDYKSAIQELDAGKSLLDAVSPPAPGELIARFDLEKGLVAFNKHQFVEALNNFRNGLNRTGLTDLALKRRLQLFIAQCNLSLKQPEETSKALEVFFNQDYNQQWAEIAESNFKIASTLDLQLSAFNLGRSEQIWAGITEFSSQAEYYLDYTRLLLQTRQYTEAISAAEAAFQLLKHSDSCNKLEVCSLLGLLNSRLKDFDKARDWLKQAQLSLETNPCNTSIVMARYFQAAAEMAAATGQTDEASTFYQQALDRLESPAENPAEASTIQELRGEIYFELGQTSRQLGKFEEALNYIEKAYRLH